MTGACEEPGLETKERIVVVSTEAGRWERSRLEGRRQLGLGHVEGQQEEHPVAMFSGCLSSRPDLAHRPGLPLVPHCLPPQLV